MHPDQFGVAVHAQFHQHLLGCTFERHTVISLQVGVDIGRFEMSNDVFKNHNKFSKVAN
jgi:hypothetical protein